MCCLGGYKSSDYYQVENKYPEENLKVIHAHFFCNSIEQAQ
jgi:hypothetical protein